MPCHDVVRHDKHWVEPDRLRVVGNCFVGLALVIVGNAPVAVLGGVLRTEPDGFGAFDDSPVALVVIVRACLFGIAIGRDAVLGRDFCPSGARSLSSCHK